MNPDAPDQTPLVDWDALDRYLAGEADAAETADVRSFLSRRTDAETLLRAPDRLYLDSSDDDRDDDLAAAWDAMVVRVARPSVVRPKPSHRGGRAVAWMAAAGLAVFVGVLGWPSLSAWRQSTSPASGGRVYTTTIGQRARIVLPDGSSAILAPESRLNVSSGFGRSAREVELVGEAVFTVIQSSGTPFVVRAGGAATRVLGTTFSVRKYAADTAVRVAVAQGRVMLNTGPVLSAGDVAQATAGNVPTVQRTADVAAYFGWTDGRLRFRYAPVLQVLQELSRWYDLEIRLSDRVATNESIMLSLDNASEREMLHTLALSLNARMEREGRRVTLYPK